MLENREIFKVPNSNLIAIGHNYSLLLSIILPSLILLEVFRLFFKFRNYVKNQVGIFIRKETKTEQANLNVNNTTKFSTLDDICEA